MRSKLISASVPALFATLIAGGSAFASEPPKILTASGYEVTTNVVDPGTATCIGGVETGNPYSPCDGSRRVLIRHQVVQTVVLPDPPPVGSAVPLLAGVNTLTVNCSLDGNLKGSCWGTFDWIVDDEAAWGGVASGTFDFSDFSFTYQLVGRGFGGVVDGMHLSYEVVYPGGLSFVGEFAARVIAPKAP